MAQCPWQDADQRLDQPRRQRAARCAQSRCRSRPPSGGGPSGLEGWAQGHPRCGRDTQRHFAGQTIHRIVAAACAISGEFGLLVETAATTGARVSQLAGLEVQDVQHDRTHLRLMMPSSKKGKGKKKIIRRPVPIPESLALRLRQAGRTRPSTPRCWSSRTANAGSHPITRGRSARRSRAPASTRPR